MIEPPPTLAQQLAGHIMSGEIAQCLDIFEQHPGVLGHSNSFVRSWLHFAASYGHLPLIEYLFGKGADINFAYGSEQWTPLDSAIAADEMPHRTDVVRFLLARGASPNISRALLAAINPRRGDEATSLELVRLLVEAGADVNREYDIYGDKNNTFTALEFAEMHGRSAIAAYLRSVGAKDRAPPAAPAKGKRK